MSIYIHTCYDIPGSRSPRPFCGASAPVHLRLRQSLLPHHPFSSTLLSASEKGRLLTDSKELGSDPIVINEYQPKVLDA
jgi:hypothetical protein